MGHISCISLIVEQINEHANLKKIALYFSFYGFQSCRYGDPQKRRRVFVTACRNNLLLHTFPRETHDSDKPVTVSEALDDLSVVDPVPGNEFVVLPDTGKVIHNHGVNGTAMKSEVEKLKADEPAHTVRRKDNIKHYKHERTLTIREMARLQSFPDDFQFCGSRCHHVNGIGNAVPVKIATVLASSIHSMYSTKSSRSV